MSFKEPKSNPNFPEMEEKTIKFWKKDKIFEKSVEQKNRNNCYSFYDGPPFITGLPHYGNLLGSIAKDLIPRYQTMKGKRVRRVWGWDCHGLPIEEKTEKKLGLKNRRDIEKIGIDRFISECRNYVSEISAEWNWYINRIGRWVDMENAYRTMDLKYMESVIWSFKQLYDKGLIYQGLKTLLYCTRCGTPVSKFEIAMDDSYAEMKDPAVTVEFPIVSKGKFQDVRILAWTTTPWTLPSNRALVVNKDEVYVEFSKKDNTYVVALKRIEQVLKNEEYKEIRRFNGQELIGLNYQAPYNYFLPNDNDFKIYDYQGMVNMEEGTGIVHSAPGFGEVDTEMGKHYGLTTMFTVDDEGKFIDKVIDFKGIYVKDADKLIIQDLKQRNFLFNTETITHRYPYCYRCQTPLIYKTVKAWFVNVQKIKPKMLELNKNINWVPDFFKEGRFKYTIETAPDWCVSRTRYWATIMPIWKCEKCENLKVIGSIKEIEENSIEKVKINDLHRTGVDNVRFKCEKCQGEMRRIPEVFDCWFESGSMPYGERHYPFENKEDFEKSFPTDYIAEYTGQLRAWFYYLHALSTALFNSHSFKNVVVTGVIAGTDGRKMSKSYKNYPDPKHVLEKYGGDALRLYLMGSPLMMGRDINMTKGQELLEQVKTILLPLWNSYKFFATFANLVDWEPGKDISKSDNVLDKWINSRFNQFHFQFSDYLDKYYVSQAIDLIRDFLADLSKWYIRRSRERFRAGDINALSTLYWVLMKLVKTLAPVVPFVTETLYRNLSNSVEKESVHLEDWPEKEKVDNDLLEQMRVVRDICSLAHAIRKENQIKARQPLLILKVKIKYQELQKKEKMISLIMDEVNVKQIVFSNEIKQEDDWAVKQGDNLELSLFLRLTEELKEEGIVREIIRHIQQMRRKSGLEPKDRILIYMSRDEYLNKILLKNKDVIIQKTIAEELHVKDKRQEMKLDAEKEVKIKENQLFLGIKKV